MLKKNFIAFTLLSFFSLSLTQAATFTDQSNIPSWGNAAVEALVEAEIISGNADGSLAPWRSINRAEFLKILTTATEVDLIANSGVNFPDVPSDAWFAPYVHTAVSLGWAKGYPDGYFRPGNLINRAEIAKLLSEAWDLPLSLEAADAQWYDIYVRALVDAELLPQGATFSNFEAGKNPSRIEVFEQLHRVWNQEAVSEAGMIPAIAENETGASEPDTETTAVGATVEGDSETEAATGSSTENNGTTEETTPPSDGGSNETETETETEENNEAGSSTPTVNPETILPPTVADESQLSIEALSAASTQVIYPGQGGITAFTAQLEPLADEPVIKSLTFTHSGNAPVTNFSRMWINNANERISEEIIPTGNTNMIRFQPALVVTEPMTIYLKLDTPSEAEPGYTSRWSVEAVTDIDSTTDTSQISFPIFGQRMDIYPE